jgi:hypothetical protein
MLFPRVNNRDSSSPLLRTAASISR